MSWEPGDGEELQLFWNPLVQGRFNTKYAYEVVCGPKVRGQLGVPLHFGQQPMIDSRLDIFYGKETLLRIHSVNNVAP